ncbi:MAG: SMC family ATPase [Armatimonadetes bacterium]|nr:SMC family ATPase [Armatimonadota bacterium]
MLPIQITLEGFMSYRDAATLSFEGASLWMLSGGNGAGKSTVFDAMRWTLFNRHRGGGQGHEALIHHDKTKLRVAFDLEVSSGRFRLMRTLSRGGKSTWQIERLNGETTEKVPETDGRDGYNHWLSENLALSDETFGAAFYLAQGRGDAILNARPEERYEMLAEIVDLSAFQRLHESAKTRAIELESEARAGRAQWENAPDIDPADIEELARKLAHIEAHIEDNRHRREELSHLLPWALQWQSLESTRRENAQYLETARQILEDAPQIERDFARLGELETLLPPLQNWLDGRERAAQNATQTEQLKRNCETAQQKMGAAERDLKRAATRRDVGENELRKREGERVQALSRLQELAPSLAEIAQLEKWRGEARELEGQLRDFSDDLAERKKGLENRIAKAVTQTAALAILHRFSRARGDWQISQPQILSAQKQKIELETARPAAENTMETAEAALQKSREDSLVAAQTLAAATARRLDAEKAIARFEEVRGEANCHFCGQKLTPQHAQSEAARLKQALATAQNEEQTAQNARDAAQLAVKSAQSEAKVAQSALQNLELALQKVENELDNAEKSREVAARSGAEALRELPGDFAARFDGQSSTHWDEARVAATLQNSFPTADDLDALRAAAAPLSQWQNEAKVVAQNLVAREKIAARLEAVAEQIEPLMARYDEALARRILAEEAELQRTLQFAEASLESLQTEQREAAREMERAQLSLESVRGEVAAGQNQLAALGAAQIEIERALQLQRGAANATLKTIFARELEPLRADFTGWKNEQARLQTLDLPTRAAQLREGRERIAALESEAQAIELSLQNVPEAARRAPQELESEADELRRQSERGEEERRALQLEIAGLERGRAEKARLQKSLVEAETRARQHKTLAELLGPRQLQRHLLREAENGIVDEANGVLDRISSGTLRLDLRADDDDIAGARKGPPKVLDVAVSHSGGDHSTPAMLPAFLSGSQRFRVAVALALGIGRYATRGAGHGRLEAVIIDEGFGSLDKIGRGEMIDELKALGEELKRVILVSHQEEFADAFPNRYLIEHDGAASTARLMAF